MGADASQSAAFDEVAPATREGEEGASRRRCHPDFSDWCRGLQHLTLNQLWAIPGTHNSACSQPRSSLNAAWPWARTQRHSISEQLRMGVRAFDLRVCDDAGDGQVWLSHTFLSAVTLREVLRCMAAFLEGHPTEFVLLLVRRDHARGLAEPRQLAELLAGSGLRLAPCGPDGLDVRVGAVAGAALVAVSGVGVSCPDWWPDDLFEGAGLVPMWHWGSMDEAKARVEEHVLSGQHLITTSRQLTGVALDGSFGLAPPEYWAVHLHEWILALLQDPAVPAGRLGVLMVDFATAPFCAAIASRSVAEASGAAPAACGAQPPRAAAALEDPESGGQVPRGICHVGVSRARLRKTVVVCTRRDLPEACSLRARAFGNRHSDVYECSAVRLAPRRFELTVCRTDAKDGGWGQDLFVEWEAADVGAERRGSG